MPSVETPAVSKAGIITSATGERHIPSSVRPDGSVRKAIRVRPGYRPPEDVEVYRNKATEAFRNRAKAGVPGAEGLKSAEVTAKPSPAANKNAKRKEARKKAAAAATDDKDNNEDPNSVESKEDVKPTETKEGITETVNSAESIKPVEVDPQVEKEKEVKKLLKKLRQAGELKDKKDKGDKMLPEQLEKIIKINELLRKLEALGYNAQGKKTPDA